MVEFFRQPEIDVKVHSAAQLSHDLAARRPFDDFDVNAMGTMNLLGACRWCRPEAIFVHLSTNKVYGGAPNLLPLTNWRRGMISFAAKIETGLVRTCQ